MAKTPSKASQQVGIALKVNNGNTVEICQEVDDGPIEVRRVNSKDVVDTTFTILPGDMVTLLNWFQYQKGKGNTNLYFE